jgi:hypothetical protein
VSDPTPCATCGTPLQADAKFCGSCGTSVAAPGGDEPTAATPPTTDPESTPEPLGGTAPVLPSGEPTTGTTAFGTGDPDAPAPPEVPVSPPTDGSIPPVVPPTQVGGLGAITAPPGPLGEPAGFAAPGTPPGGIPPVAYPPTAANPTASPLPPTLADQAVASSGGLPPGGAPPGGPPTDGERPHWMPDPSKESKSSRTGLFIVLGVAGGVLVTLILLLLVLVLGGDDGDDEVSSGDTTSTTEASTTTTTERQSTTTTEERTTTTEASTTTTTEAPVGPLAFEVGDCVTTNLVDGESEVSPDAVVACDQPHRAELVAFFDLPAGPFPGPPERRAITTERCLGQPFEDYVGTGYQSSQIYVTGVFPDEPEWDAGRRTIWCFGHEREADEVSQSFRNSGR